MNSQADNRAQQVKAIFLEALDREAGAERRSYLEAACAGNTDLRGEVESLLLAHEKAGEFLDPAAFGAGVGLGGANDDSPLLTEGPGTVIGRYKLLEKIGEGGMAVVYMAEQTEPIRRKVALKIIKLGMDTRQVIARFEAERQALALMDHPSIAKVLDAGATETGRPYFVMELVSGVSITEYCDQNSLSTKDRLNLFLQVCHAVQHAHQKGIIHRDIKPSNVMVTHHDGKPVPKVIDFGIAKATNQKLTEKTLFTRYAHLIGTPAYMSPEQAELSDLDIDTRSDIYSLGVLLYELLTETTPFSEEELRKVGYVEMQRVIREQEPVKPSTRIKTALRRASVPARQKTSGGHGGPPLREVQGDLDWIVMKSLEKDRARRYETTSGLAEDIRRHLEHEPVLARGPSTTYRLRKFLRRHRVQILGGVAVAALIAVVAGILSIWNQDRLQWNRDRLQLAEADGLREQALLSQAQGQYASGDRDTALDTIQPILDSPHVGGKAQLLRAGILVDNRRFQEATTILGSLLQERPEIAGTAHALLARILWESEALDAERLKEFEEHRRQAEESLPQSAEAYFLRAMTAPTIREQLAALDKALELTPEHYESLRLRAFTYYASRKYTRMREDALGMTYLRRGDPLGYSLRAIALCELGEYEDALVEYDRALARLEKTDPQYLDLITQRSATLLRKGDYERVVAEAEGYTKLVPDPAVFQHHRFAALTALGNYDKAAAVFEEIVCAGQEARQQFRNWCAKHVFDNLQAGRSWHPGNNAPAGPAFLPLAEAEETFRALSAKGRRITTDGFSAQWSPDGRKLAFSLGVRGRSGVALFDPATKETDLLIVPGKYPKWSPDGRYIAFVRDRQFLRVPEFVAADPKNQPPAPNDQEVWFVKSDGTEPRRLARGVWPSWSQDSTCLYYRSRLDSNLYSISIRGENVEPTRVTPCPGYNPSMSPDGQQVAYIEDTSLKVKDVASQSLIAEWPLPSPSEGWSVPAWSPDGKELGLGGSGGLENATGLWIYRLGQREPAQTLGGPITVGSWAGNSTKLIFELGGPYFEIWTADLPANAPAAVALGPSRTPEEYFRVMVALCTHRIETDPRDAYAYSSRARCHDCLRERAKAEADMKRWSAVMSGRSAFDPWFGAPADRRCVIDMPFDCELVFSAERPVNEIPTMSVAFGQKGRCEMKLLEIPIVATSLMGLCFLSGVNIPPAHAGFVFGTATNLGLTVNSAYHDYFPCISPDGLELYFSSNRPGGYGGYDIWVSKRASLQDSWGPPANLGPEINASPAYDAPGSMSADGLTLYFESSWDLCTITRATRDAPWGPRVSLGRIVVPSTSYLNSMPVISADGLELFFSSERPRGYGEGGLWVSTRATTSDPWAPPVNLGPIVGSPADESPSWLSPDGLTLLFFSNRPGGYGNFDTWMTTRPAKGSAWGPPRNLGPSINTIYSDFLTAISPDGRVCYVSDYLGPRPGGLGRADLWQAPIIPVVDFNGDGKVDEKDLALLVVDWGKSNSPCDIGPYPWGDGIVDTHDLSVLLKEMTGSGIALNPRPDTAEVALDAVLSWTSVSFTQSYDVYLGTLQEAVKTASRTNPQSVLVSKAQVGTTYDPADPLKYSQTYYWRVDFVIAGPTPTIYQGPVLSFTTEAYARPIKNITVTASPSQVNMGPEKTIDGSGLDKSDGHSTSGTDMWLSTTGPHWIQYQFDKIYTLHELWVWNSNQPIESFIGFGAKTVKIEYSVDGTKWTQLANAPEFAKATGKPGYTANTIVNFAGVPAKYVKLTIEKAWGSTPSAGLSEVRFFAIQSAAVKP